MKGQGASVEVGHLLRPQITKALFLSFAGDHLCLVVIVHQLKAGMEDGEFIHRLAALLVMLFQLLHDRRLLHNSVVRLVFTNPMGQFAFACPHRECIGILLDGRDDHPLEVEEGGGTLQDAGDDPLDVL